MGPVVATVPSTGLFAANATLSDATLKRIMVLKRADRLDL